MQKYWDLYMEAMNAEIARRLAIAAAENGS
jgi:hypothetical protein